MPDKLDEIAARLAKATPGPWFATKDAMTGTDNDIIREGSTAGKAMFIAPVYRLQPQSEYDSDLIAHAPTDLRYLLDRLAAAEAVCEAAEQHTQAHLLCDADCRVEDGSCPYFGILSLLTTWQAAKGEG